ncbi:MAG: cyclopropane-fatty-acyl-phospholipid synthase family protein [Spongiibacteraceae bacterium]
MNSTTADSTNTIADSANKIADNTNKNVSRSRIGFSDAMAKRCVLALCEKIAVGHLLIKDGDETYHFGQAQSDADITAHIVVHDASTYRAMFLHGSVGAGEAYMAKAWSTPDLLSVIQLMIRNLSLLNSFDSERPWLNRLTAKLGHWLNRNNREGSRKNIAAHYDLSNDFFQTFLDPTLMYSSAIYPSTDASLEQASLHKLDTICRKLQLSSADHLLEIGTGWGGLAMHAATHYGCQVTTTTISKEQFDLASERIKAAGLEDRITVLFEDYRDLQGGYDKLVSIEMIEAVGHEYYETYFAQCSKLVKPNGLMLIQAITIPDQRYDYARTNTDFIKKYIFPGGCLPSNAVIARCVEKCTDLQIVHLDDISLHYARTLADWHTRFKASLDTIQRMQFDERFCLMWEFYLKYCEGGFRERAVSASQILFAKPQFRFR